MRATVWITCLAAAAATLAVSNTATAQPPTTAPACPSTGAVKNDPPVVMLKSAPQPGTAAKAGMFVLRIEAKDPNGDKLRYAFFVTGGKVSGGGADPKGVWDLSGVEAGSYTVTSETDDGRGRRAYASVNVDRP